MVLFRQPLAVIIFLHPAEIHFMNIVTFLYDIFIWHCAIVALSYCGIVPLCIAHSKMAASENEAAIFVC